MEQKNKLKLNSGGLLVFILGDPALDSHNF